MSTVTIDDVAALDYCRKGCRQLAERYGFDWRDFLINGIASSKLEQIDDAMVKALIEQSQRREASEK